MVHFDFEQRGGRLKLLQSEEGGDTMPFRQCLPEEIREAMLKLKEKLKIVKEARRQEQSQRQQNWTMVEEFLSSHQFAKDVNAVKHSYLGFVRTYPLHQAAKDGNWQMMDLLLSFGADPKQKDSAGRCAIQYTVRRSGSGGFVP
ncbi:unnamed protein product [Cladocopium goreaui]|uniref:Mannosyltransferase KTR3 n=1 Tax=Cladocopium goreaui TaxID=2562237 RepID=A0A9P1G639_9DINO|nr:unnamed protein product [Cladocopium goreaui]|mmetsp:Transcript_59220/g.129918  ORF Transcript_59220/g.129918 Transcript_59220/m.129918 type:complete len:144 (-) Transcript_59220:22-453(-)